MISADLLALLRCPENHQPLLLADRQVLEAVNARISVTGAATLRNRGGEPVREPLAAGLVRLDQSLLYPVRAGIPNLLVEEAIFL